MSDLTGGLVFNPQGGLTIHNWASNQNQLNVMGLSGNQSNAGSSNGSSNGGGQMGQLTVSTNSPQAASNTHSPSSSSIKVKNEPISPPRDLSQQHHQQQQQQQHQHVINLNSRASNNNNNTNSHLSPGHPPLTPSSSSSPDPSGSDYDDGPMHKRLRVTTDGTWPA